MVAWHDAVTNTLNIQVNDGAAATVAYSSGAMDTTYPLTIGAHADGAGAWDGRIDEVFLYKRVLNADERTWLYNNGQGRSYVEVQPVPSSSASLLTYAASVTGCMGGGRTIAHAVSAMGSSNTYTYDCNGNQTRHISGSDTYDLVYDAENRLSQVKKNNIVIATFTYDGDSNRVKSVLGTETTLFVGGHYEVTNPGAGQTVTKYYFAGSTRVAMRKYTIPQSMTVEYFLGDHLGSTSITTDSAGAKVSEIRYQPWGEIRYAWKSGTVTTPAYKLASYTFTGQYSYMDDPTTTGVTEGFGLMYYNARFYSPYINHFIQPDSIIPGGVQGLDRYAYVNNSPIRFTDPSGHRCFPKNECKGAVGQGEPDDVDFSKLDSHVYRGTGVSGQMMYSFYLQVWEENGGYVTIKEFLEMVMSHEFEPYQNRDGTLNFVPGSNFNQDLLQTTTANWYWGLHQGETSVSTYGALNWIASFASAGMAYRAGSLTSTKASGLARDVISYVYNLHGITRNDPTAPSTFGNLSMFPTEKLRSASQGTGFDQYIAAWPNQQDNNPAYILSACQVAYQNGNTDYVKDQC